MTTMLIAIAVFVLAVAGLGLGFIVRKRPLCGSCGNCSECIRRNECTKAKGRVMSNGIK